MLLKIVFCKTSGSNNQLAVNGSMLTPATNDTFPHVNPTLNNNKTNSMHGLTSNLENVLDKVLYKLEQIHRDRYEDYNGLPDGQM